VWLGLILGIFLVRKTTPSFISQHAYNSLWQKVKFSKLKLPPKFSKNLKMLSIPYFGYEAISKFYETILGSFLKIIIIIINVVDMVYHTISSPKIIFTKLSSLSYSLFLKMHAMVHMPVLALFITK
jgi:hypothetical protein